MIDDLLPTEPDSKTAAETAPQAEPQTESQTEPRAEQPVSAGISAEQFFSLLGDLFYANAENRVTSVLRKRNEVGAALLELLGGEEKALLFDHLCDTVDDLLGRASAVNIPYQTLAGIFNPSYLSLEKGSSEKGKTPSLPDQTAQFQETYIHLYQALGEYLNLDPAQSKDTYGYSLLEWTALVAVMRHLRRDEDTSLYIKRLRDPRDKNKKWKYFIDKSSLPDFFQTLSRKFTKEELHQIIFKGLSLNQLLASQQKAPEPVSPQNTGHSELPVLTEPDQYTGIMKAVSPMYRGDSTTEEGREALHKIVLFVKEHPELKTYLHRFYDPHDNKTKDYVEKEKEDEFQLLLRYHLPNDSTSSAP